MMNHRQNEGWLMNYLRIVLLAYRARAGPAFLARRCVLDLGWIRRDRAAAAEPVAPAAAGLKSPPSDSTTTSIKRKKFRMIHIPSVSDYQKAEINHPKPRRYEAWGEF